MPSKAPTVEQAYQAASVIAWSAMGSYRVNTRTPPVRNAEHDPLAHWCLVENIVEFAKMYGKAFRDAP